MRARLAVVAALLTSWSAACSRPPTQLLVVVETDVPETDFTCVRVHAERVGGDGIGGVDRAFRVPAETRVPFSFGVVPPDGDARARVELVAELRTDDCDAPRAGEAAPLVRRAVRTGFLPEQTLRLPIYLGARCRDVSCADDATCDPGSARCEPVPELEPLTLDPVRPGEELVDAGRRPDAWAAIDAGSFDAGASLDAGAPLDVGAPLDSGPPRDAWLPDAGPGCPTAGTTVGSTIGGGTLLGFSLTASRDGTRGLRGVVLRGTSADWAGAQDLGGGSPGSAYYPPPGSSTGPSGVAFLADATASAVVFGLSPGGIRFSPLFGFSNDISLGGACPSPRCVESIGTDFAVLVGPTSLSLAQVRVSPLGRGATATRVGSVAVASGTTGGGVRPAAAGVLVVYAMAGACYVERWPDFAARGAQLMVPLCTAVDAAELPGGQVGVAWRDPANAVHAAVADAGLAVLGADVVLDASQAEAEPVLASPTRRGFRVSWVDDSASPLVRSAALDTTATVLQNDCAATSGHTLADYRWLQAVRRGDASAVEWAQTRTFYGATFTDP
jgi:hypothetical protein